MHITFKYIARDYCEFNLDSQHIRTAFLAVNSQTSEYFIDSEDTIFTIIGMRINVIDFYYYRVLDFVFVIKI